VPGVHRVTVSAGGGVPEDEGADDLRRAQDREPDSHQAREDRDRRYRRGGDDDARDEADRPEEHPPAMAVDRPRREAGQQPHQALDDPGDADQQPDDGGGEVDVPHQHHPEHDQQQAHAAKPAAVLLAPVEHAYQVDDPGDDEQDAEQDRDDAQ
jgi:hypothetical protein